MTKMQYTNKVYQDNTMNCW